MNPRMNNYQSMGVISRYISANPAGHGESFYRAFNKSLAPTAEPIVLGCKDAPPALAKNLFPSWAARQVVPLSPLATLYLKFARVNNWVSDSKFENVLIYDGALEDLWLAWNLAIKQPNSNIIFNFHFADQIHKQLDLDNSQDTTLSLRSRLRSLLKKKPKNLLLFAESRVLSQVLAAKLGCSIFEFPCPTTIEIPKLTVAKERNIDVLLVSRDDNLDWVRLFLWELCSDSEKELKIIVQDFSEKLSVITDCYSVVSGKIPWEEYSELNARAKVVVLPYFSDFYRLGSSGRLQDALISEAFPFVPEGTAMFEWLVRRSGSAPYPYDADFRPREIASSVKEFLVEPIAPPQALTFHDMLVELENHVEANSSILAKSSMRLSRLELLLWAVLQMKTVGPVETLRQFLWDLRAALRH